MTGPFVDERRRVGQVKEVTSLANPLVKELRALSLKKNRDRARSFMAEGLKLVIEALDRGWTIRTLVCAKSARGRPAVDRVAARAVAAGALVLEASEKVVAAIARRDNPQTVIGVFEQRYRPLAELAPGRDDTVVALDRVRDPGNLGTIIRTADAAGAAAVVLIGETTDPFALETVRATMGSVFCVPLARTDAAGFVGWAGDAGMRLVGTHLSGAVDYRTVDYRGAPVALVMGNEQAGLPDTLAGACHVLARIPQAGTADSLNLAVATGVMLFEARRHLLSIEPRR